ICEQYFKAYPVCRWAQPAVEAALSAQRDHGFAADEIAHITIETFSEAVALGSGRALPHTTDDAQYSLLYSVAAALVFRRLGDEEMSEKYFGLATPVLGQARAERIERAVDALPDNSALSALLEDLHQPAA